MKFSIKMRRLLLCAAGLILVIAVAAIVFNSQSGGSDPNDVLHDTMVRGVRDNIGKLSSVVLVWRAERKHFDQSSSRPDTGGDYQLWWDGKRTAISSKASQVFSDPNGQVSSRPVTKYSTYDGKKFRVAEMPQTPAGTMKVSILKKPRYSLDENYLEDVGWHGIGPMTWVSIKPDEPGTQHYSIEGNLVKVTFRNSRTGQVGVRTYDAEKAYGLVRLENYAEEGKLRVLMKIQYKEVSGGVWFPISIVTEGYNIQNGELTNRTKLEVDVEKSVFNDPAAIPEEVFKLKIGPNAKVRDLTSLGTRVRMWLNDF